MNSHPNDAPSESGEGIPDCFLSEDGRSLTASVAPVRQSAQVTRELCLAFAETHGAGAATLDAVALAVTEAVGNAVLYAYPGGRPGRVRLHARIDDRRNLQIDVTDSGVGLAYPSVSRGMGRGLSIIEQVTDDLRVTSSADDGTTIRMTFELRR